MVLKHFKESVNIMSALW